MSKIWPNQIAAHLQQHGVPIITFLYGDEPLLSIESADAVRAAASSQSFELRRFILDNQVNWSEIQAELGAMSLFGDQKLIMLQLPFEAKLPDRFSDNLLKTLPLCAEGSQLLIQVGALTSKQTKAKWFKTLSDQALICQCKTPKDNQLLRWIQDRLSQAKIRHDRDVVNFLAYRCNGNLLAAKQEIDILKLAQTQQAQEGHNQPLSVAMTKQICSDHARFTVIDLKDACLGGHYQQANHILHHLEAQTKSSQIFGLVIMLQKEVQKLINIQTQLDDGLPLAAALKNAQVLSFLEKVYREAFTHINPQKLRHLVELADTAERAAKGASPLSAWMTLNLFVAVFAARKPTDTLMPFVRSAELEAPLHAI